MGDYVRGLPLTARPVCPRSSTNFNSSHTATSCSPLPGSRVLRGRLVAVAETRGAGGNGEGCFGSSSRVLAAQLVGVRLLALSYLRLLFSWAHCCASLVFSRTCVAP